MPNLLSQVALPDAGRRRGNTPNLIKLSIDKRLAEAAAATEGVVGVESEDHPASSHLNEWDAPTREMKPSTGLNALQYAIERQNKLSQYYSPINIETDNVITEQNATYLETRNTIEDDFRQWCRDHCIPWTPVTIAMAAQLNTIALGKPIDTLSQVMLLTEGSRIERLHARYDARLQTIDLPPDGFQTKEQEAAAARLSQTYRQLKKLEEKEGIAITPKDPRVREAERLRVDFNRKHPKAEP